MEPRAAARLAPGLACALALLLQARFAREQLEAPPRPSDDPAPIWLAWLERLPPIPLGATVGFVTTIEPGQPEARLFLTRYALAPRAVVQGPGADLVLGHFSSAAEAAELSRRAGLSILGGTSEGLFLMRRQAP